MQLLGTHVPPFLTSKYCPFDYFQCCLLSRSEISHCTTRCFKINMPSYLYIFHFVFTTLNQCVPGFQMKFFGGQLQSLFVTCTEKPFSYYEMIDL